MKEKRLLEKRRQPKSESIDAPRSVRNRPPRRRDGAVDLGSSESNLSRTVAKALSIVEYVGIEHLTTIPQLSARTGLPKSTLHRLIGTLLEQKFLYRTAHGQYKVSFKLWRIGASAVDFDTIRESARDILSDLVKKSSETAHYSVYESGYAVYVEKLDGLHPIRSYTAVGGRSPAHASATGKALLAWQSEEEILRVAEESERFTASTLVGRAEILRDMSEVRENGYAVNRGEWRHGVWGIAAPVFGPGGDVLAAIGVSGPEERINGALPKLVKLVTRAAKELSQGERPDRGEPAK
jgi:DNA-binding IclR family transcriptional regulator